MTVMMLICEFVLLWFLGAKVQAPVWYWLVYALMVSRLIVPLVQGFVAGFQDAGESDDSVS